MEDMREREIKKYVIIVKNFMIKLRDPEDIPA